MSVFDRMTNITCQVQTGLRLFQSKMDKNENLLVSLYITSVREPVERLKRLFPVLLMEKEMNNERQQFLNLKTLPARLDVQEAAWYLGFASHDMPILGRAGLLKPLGRPPTNGVKHFATAALANLHADPQWLARASDAVVKHWQSKNIGKLKSHDGQSIM